MRSSSRIRIGLVVLISALVAVPAGAQCSGLHAGLQAQHVMMNREPHVELLFFLLNDAQTPLDVHQESWKLVINGKDVDESNMLFGNGPIPAGGYTTLQPGEHYEFGRTLSVSRFFETPGDYTVIWKGDGFEANTLTITVPPPKPAVTH